MTITIRHTPADGTLVEGTSRGDGTAPTLKAHGFRWFRTIGMWGIPGSRDRAPQQRKIDAAAEALRGAGHTVEVDVDSSHRDTATVEADRAARAEARADALAAKADRKSAAADAAWAAERKATDILPPFGQPILIGHHSERRHRNQIERAHQATRRAIDATDEAKEVARRANIAAGANAHRYSPVTVKNRLDKLEAEQRRDQRELDGYTRTVAKTATTTYVDQFDPATGGRRDQLLDRMAQRADQINYWSGVYGELQAAGKASTLSRETVKPGDEVLYRRSWYVVHRANLKTVSVKLLGEHVSFTNKIGYHKLSGHRSAGGEEGLS